LRRFARWLIGQDRGDAMGLLDQILSGGAPVGSPQAARNRSVNSRLAAGVILALAVKAIHDRRKPPEGRSFDAGRAPDTLPAGEAGATRGGGVGDILGGVLGGLGGAGALGGLIGALQQKGLDQQASSWVGTGPNQTVAPHQLAEALGEDTIQELQQHTGLARGQLLSDLARELPEAVNQATPAGQLPTDEELDRVAEG